MNAYRLTRQAMIDIDQIWDYIGNLNENPAAADKLVGRFHKTFENLAAAPGSGHRRDDLTPGLRVFPCGNYVVFYHPTENGVDITGVVHGRRNWAELFEVGQRQT